MIGPRIVAGTTEPNLGRQVQIRPLRDGDVEAVLALNEESVELLAPLTAEQLDRLRATAAQALVVDDEGTVAAFVLAFGPGVDYDSPNYRWFASRYGDEFAYLDRIAVGEAWRRRGIGRLVYDTIEAAARPYGRLACEVNAVPPNEGSLAFHAARGFREVGRLTHPGGKVTAMLVKQLGKRPGHGDDTLEGRAMEEHGEPDR